MTSSIPVGRVHGVADVNDVVGQQLGWLAEFMPGGGRFTPASARRTVRARP
ncbi:hypothetical protein [Streptomyces lutosisoli]|uniref:Uncharacterized protein n=1 Tax=Streptomyces lutosisoli TaxID=2665721 RepID=A0ABW2VSR6_9ACTN